MSFILVSITSHRQSHLSQSHLSQSNCLSHLSQSNNQSHHLSNNQSHHLTMRGQSYRESFLPSFYSFHTINLIDPVCFAVLFLSSYFHRVHILFPVSLYSP
uniref:Uncharacterized protein n=1 Tax=Cacopsylla melanoneura TaxID=428564 RepID=A0A8D9E5V6_9HEMI